MQKPRLSKFIFWLTIFFLFLPLAVLVVYSFNESRTLSFTGFSLKWYEKLFTDSPGLWQAMGNSLLIALSSALLATVIGTLGAVAINWYRFRFKNFIHALSFFPLILPEIIIGVSILIFFAMIQLPLGLLSIFIAHTSFTMPFVLLMVLARLGEFDFSIIEAARDLGAKELQTLTKVIIPISLPGIIAGFLTAFTLSLEDFVVTFFVSGPGSTTLPVFLYSAIKKKFPPEVNALSVIIILATVLLVVSARKFTKYLVKK